jgi:hypothetical protein
MKTATLRLKINKEPHDVGLTGVTPAELQYLIVQFMPVVQDMPVEMDRHFRETEDVERTPAAELNRLCAKYSRKKIMAMFKGGVLPATFQEAIDMGKAIEGEGLQTQQEPLSVLTI